MITHTLNFVNKNDDTILKRMLYNEQNFNNSYQRLRLKTNSIDKPFHKMYT